ncbi:MAG: hypothetical protein JW795_04695 [Chitinivibrionales bacterium]|nr:hypothetical protein [Chitinivibrionales bacterium]
MKNFFIFLALLSSVPLRAQENQAATITSCSLAVRTTVLPPQSADRFGKVEIVATLHNEAGEPISGHKIEMNTNCGTFSCLLQDLIPTIETQNSQSAPNDSSTVPLDFCFTTNESGAVQLYLINVPFNIVGRVDASCSCGDMKVKASGTFQFTKRSKAKKKSTKRSSWLVPD